MPKMAYLDVDMTLVDNTNSAYNAELIDYLADPRNGFDEVYLVTGRNVADLWRHVLRQGEPAGEWRNQLLPNVATMLRRRGINVVGVSTPYDHYFVQSGQTRYQVNQAGDAAELFYMEFETHVNNMQQPTIHSISETFNNLTGGNSYPDIPGGAPDQLLTDALPTYLATIEDTEKRGQFEFLLNRVKQEHLPAECEVVFWDDKPENLRTFNELCEAQHFQAYSAILVNDVETYQLPEENQQEPYFDKGGRFYLGFNGLVEQLATNTQEQRNLNDISAAKEQALLQFIQRLNEARRAFELSNGKDFTAFQNAYNGAVGLVKPILSTHDQAIFGPIFAAISHFFLTLWKVICGEPRNGIGFFDSRTTAAKEFSQFENEITAFITPGMA